MMTKSRSPLGLSPSAGDADDTVVDVVVESALWANQPAASAMVRHAIATAAAVLRTPALPRSRRGAGAKRGGERGNEGSGRGEVAVVLADDAAVRVLNRDWRRIDKPTNVLSFPAPPPLRPPSSRSVPFPTKRGRLWEGAEKGEAGGAQMPPLLGDIVIAYETTAREAEAEGKPFPHHLAHLAVHGFLHLLGYDHDSDETAEAMERLEAAILRRLDMADPHAHAGA